MVVSKSKYEEIMQQRLEESANKMEELNLKKLSDGLRTPRSEKSPMKHTRPRVPRLPADLGFLGLLVFKTSLLIAIRKWHLNLWRDKEATKEGFCSIDASDEFRECAIYRARKLQSDLESDIPSFVMPMTKSHVTGGFWLGLPVQFRKEHLPSHDEYISLVDENGDASETKYLVEKTGLGAGWGGFATDHKLVDGDVLIFWLVSPREFKFSQVFIIRANEDKENVQEDNEIKRNGKEGNADHRKDIYATNLDNISKRTRAMTTPIEEYRAILEDLTNYGDEMFLGAGVLPKRLPTYFLCLHRLLIHGICLNMVDEYSVALCFIKSSPSLQKLEIDDLNIKF